MWLDCAHDHAVPIKSRERGRSDAVVFMKRKRRQKYDCRRSRSVFGCLLCGRLVVHCRRDGWFQAASDSAPSSVHPILSEQYLIPFSSNRFSNSVREAFQFRYQSPRYPAWVLKFYGCDHWGPSRPFSTMLLTESESATSHIKHWLASFLRQPWFLPPSWRLASL